MTKPIITCLECGCERDHFRDGLCRECAGKIIKKIELSGIEIHALTDWLDITFTEEDRQLVMESAPKIVAPLMSAHAKLKDTHEKRSV